MLTNPSLYRYGRSLNTHDAIKILATLFMIIDHIGWYVLNDYLPCRLIGRGAAPLFFFLIGYQGKVHLSVWLILYGMILSFTTGMLHYHHLWINILLNFILIHFLLHFFPLEKLSTPIRVISLVLLTILYPFLNPFLEYGTLGILLAFGASSVAKQEESAPLWLGGTLSIFGIYQIFNFSFQSHLSFLISIMILFLGLYFIMVFYTLRPLPCPQAVKLPALFISRYSLHVYFFHVILLQSLRYL